jgi:hypothetical protein
MADRAFMYCPLCRSNGNNHTELIRDSHIYTCPLGHTMTNEQIQKLNPELIKLQTFYKPRPTDVKTEFFCHPEIAQRIKNELGDGYHRTLESILEVCLTGEYVLVDGVQAKELRTMNIKNGAEMLACAKNNKELEGENLELKKQVDHYERIFSRAASEATAID